MPNANVPLGCKMTIEALKPGVNGAPDATIASQDFTFTPVIKSNVLPPPITPIYSDMDRAIVTLPPAYKYRVSAVIVQDLGALLNALPKAIRDIVAPLFEDSSSLATALILDDVKYTVSDQDAVCVN